jgi:hypothetical protein
LQGKKERQYTGSLLITKKILRTNFFTKKLPVRHGAHHRMKYLHSIGAAQLGLGRTLRVRHHSHYIAPCTADPGNVVQRAIGIGG